MITLPQNVIPLFFYKNRHSAYFSHIVVALHDAHLNSDLHQLDCVLGLDFQGRHFVEEDLHAARCFL